jgi:hypothetical protein
MKKYDNNIKKVFELLSLNNDYSIIGSAKNNLFFSDYDMNSLLNYKGKNIETKLYNEFLNIFKVVGKNDELCITDFKLGEDAKGEALDPVLPRCYLRAQDLLPSEFLYTLRPVLQK